MIFTVLFTVSISLTCYDTACSGTGHHTNTTIPCPVSPGVKCIHRDRDGAPLCVIGPGEGVSCEAESKRESVRCHNDYFGKALCMASSFNCYDSACHGTGDYNNTIITCDNSKMHCSLDTSGYPLCEVGSPGSGVKCNETAVGGAKYCTHDKGGKAECVTALQKYLVEIIAAVMVGVLLIFFAGFYTWKKRKVVAKTTIISNENAETSPDYGATLDNA